jgi:hypothetical protein
MGSLLSCSFEAHIGSCSRLAHNSSSKAAQERGGAAKPRKRVAGSDAAQGEAQCRTRGDVHTTNEEIPCQPCQQDEP